MQSENILDLKQNQSFGDFFEKCLPQTYDFFIKRIKHSKYSCKGIDNFDNFIKTEIKIFGFLIDSYYKKKRNPNMQLYSIADERTLFHLDKMILEYLKKRTLKNYYKIKEIYIFMLEKRIIEMIENINY